MSSIRRAVALSNLAEMAIEESAVANYWFNHRTFYTLFWQRTTVEPIIWFYMMGTMIVAIAEQSFYNYKICRSDLQFGRETCLLYRSSNNTMLINHIQKNAAYFHEFNGFIVIPLIAFSLAVMSKCSDRTRRRKPFILLALMGRLVFAITMIMLSMEPLIAFGRMMLPVSVAIWCSNLLGSHTLVMGMCFAYLSDVTTVEQRPMRILMTSIVYLSTIPIGIILGNFLYERVLQSAYPAMFTLNALFIVLAIILTIGRVHDTPRSARDQASLPSPVVISGGEQKSNNPSGLLIILLSMLFLHELQNDERVYIYLYTQRLFAWSDSDFGHFYGAKSSGYFVISMLLLYLYSSNSPLIKYDLYFIVGSVILQIMATIIYFFVLTEWLFYSAAMLSTVGVVIPLVIQVFISTLVNRHNTGQIFSFFYFLSSSVSPFVGNIIYAQIYSRTLETVPQAFFVFSTIVQNVLLLLVLLLLNNKAYQPIIARTTAG